MKLKLLSLLVVVSATLSHAQILSSGGLVTGDSSVVTLGTEENSLSVVAYALGSPLTLSNGVSFSKGTSGPLPFVTTANGITVTVSGTAGNTGALSQTAYSDSTLDAVLEASVIGDFQFSISGLNAGHTYQLQVFTADPGGPAGTELIHDVTTATLGYGGGSGGSYSAIDTFVAPVGGSQYVYTDTPSTGTGYFSAYQLRDDGVPEPSSMTMLLAGGLLTAGLVVWRRRGAVV